MKEKVVITGLGVYCPIGKNVKELHESLLESKHGISEVEEFEVAGLRNTKAARIGDIEETSTINGMRPNYFLKHAANQALEDSNLLAYEDLDRSRVGVSLGTSIGGYGGLVDLLYARNTGEKRNGTPLKSGLNPQNKLCDQDIIWNIPPVLFAYELAKDYDFTGFAACSVTACSASANAIAMAKDYMDANNIDVAIVGGVDPLTQLTYLGFNALMALTKEGLKVMDNMRSGLLIGEGAGCLVLERESHAKKRNAKIYGQMSGYGISNDAHHSTQPHPEAVGAILAIERALENADLTSKDINYVNLHGTGTKHNDLMELKALKNVLNGRLKEVPISSSKSMIGHTLGAAGAIEAVISMLALHHQILPPNINAETRIEGFEYNLVEKTVENQTLKHVLSNSFGFGGNCASIIFSQYEN